MKKFISLMLTLAMICSLLVVLPVTVSAVATTPIEQETVPPEFTNVAMLLGEDITQRNFTWFSTDAGEGKIIYEKVDEMVNGDFSANASVAVATRDTRYGEQSHKAGYYQNAAVMTGLEPGETYVISFQTVQQRAKCTPLQSEMMTAPSALLMVVMLRLAVWTMVHMKTKLRLGAEH